MLRDPETTYRIMSAVKSKNTRPEILLGKAMWKLGLRYRKQYKIKGKPDFVFVRKKIAIFCDGDFWHGNNWRIRGLNSFEEELEKYSPYWKEKILKNVERDKQVTAELEKSGWLVFRFWESDIKKDPDKLALKILSVYEAV